MCVFRPLKRPIKPRQTRQSPPAQAVSCCVTLQTMLYMILLPYATSVRCLAPALVVVRLQGRGPGCKTWGRGGVIGAGFWANVSEWRGPFASPVGAAAPSLPRPLRPSRSQVHTPPTPLGAAWLLHARARRVKQFVVITSGLWTRKCCLIGDGCSLLQRSSTITRGHGSLGG